MNWLHYLLEANLYLAVFYAGYYLFLSRETYYTLNRFYLLFGSVVSFVLPVIQLGMLKPVEQQVTAVHFAFPVAGMTMAPVQTAPVTAPFNWDNAIVYGYLLGAAVLFIVLLFKLYQLFRLTRLQGQGSDGRYKVVYLDQSDTAFSFFNYLFIGTKVDQAEMIIKHELVHIRQKHSADVIFIELLKIVNWFNPFIYLTQHSLRAIHEYIADEKTATAGTDTITYSSFLVNNAYGLSGSSITHSFFNYNLLKKRIIMLHQKRSGSLARLKYLLAVPICGGLLCVSTLAFSKTYGWVDIAPHHSINSAPVAILTTDTDKNHVPPPPPPAPPVKRVKFPLPKPLPNKTSKGYLYSEAGYVENGKQDVVVTFQEKDGSHIEYDKNKATAADLALLKEKYGYVFRPQLHMPPPPPPPPAKPSAKLKRYPPPTVFADAPVTAESHKLPPPPPMVHEFSDLYDHMAKTVRYPSDAKDKHIVGNVVVSFTLNTDHKVSNVKLVDAAGNHFDEEVVDALRSYSGTIIPANNLPYYLLGVSFNLVGDTENIRAGSFGLDLRGSQNYVCVVQLNGYIN